MLYKTLGAAVYGIDATIIEVEVDVSGIKCDEDHFHKERSGFDLPMALGILGAYGGLNKKEINDCLFVGELSLNGDIRGVRGALPIAIEARGRKISRIVVPELNAKEAAMVSGVAVYPFKSLLDVRHSSSRRSFARAQRCSVPGRTPGISSQRTRSHAPTFRRWNR